MRIALLLLAASLVATAQNPSVASLLTKDIPEFQGKEDIHVVSKNASATAPAKLLVMMLKDKDKPVLEPAAAH